MFRLALNCLFFLRVVVIFKNLKWKLVLIKTDTQPHTHTHTLTHTHTHTHIPLQRNRLLALAIVSHTHRHTHAHPHAQFPVEITRFTSSAEHRTYSEPGSLLWIICCIILVLSRILWRCREFVLFL